MNEENKTFLERLQSSDEGTKLRWLVGLSLIVMVGVVYVWLAYFNGLIVGISYTASGEHQQPEQAQGTNMTFFTTMKNGTAIIYNFFDDKIQSLGKILESPRDYIVKPPQ
jgi:ABC-type uncharacterized transport system permease subunit